MPRKKKTGLVVIAHPDDESIFFGGLILSHPETEWTVAVATDGNADGQGKKRMKQFASACRKLGVKSHVAFGFPDIYSKRLPIQGLIEKIEALGDFHQVFTHSVLGDYGHPHHQDVSYAVHLNCERPWSIAYNCWPQWQVSLSKKVFEKKAEILSTVYFSETQRMIYFLDLQPVEGYVRQSVDEVESIYLFLTQGKEWKRQSVRSYRWFIPYLQKIGSKGFPRPF